MTDLTQWAQVFGDGFKAVLMFVYWVDAPLVPDPGHVRVPQPLVPD